jgi:hypothetical protein
MKIVVYIVGFLAALGAIIVPWATGAATKGSVAMTLFGAALLVAMILMVAWNKSGTLSAGAGDADLGLSANFELDGWQWVVIAIIVAAGTAAAIIAGTVI